MDINAQQAFLQTVGQLQRKQIKTMLAEWERNSPGRIENIFAALGTVTPSHLLDPALFDFAGLGTRHTAGSKGWLVPDIA